MSKLVLNGLGKNFGTMPAVQNVSLTLQEGEFVSLLGPSGCGKTTTLRMIAGFISPTAGTIEMNGAMLSAPNRVVAPEKRGMSMIFQSYAIWPNMTVAQNVAFGLKLRKLPACGVAYAARSDSGGGAAWSSAGSLSGRTLRWPAAARRVGACHRDRAGGAAAG